MKKILYTYLMNNFTYALGRTSALLLFLLPMITTWLPNGWENLTLGVIFHVLVTYLNEKAHPEVTIVE